MINKTILLYILVLNTVGSYAQMRPFVKQFYDHVNTGDEQLYHFNDTTKALFSYNKALNLFLDSTNESSPCNLINHLIPLYANKGSDSTVFSLLKLSIKINNDKQKPEYFQPSKWSPNKKFDSFRGSKYWQYFVDSADYYYSLATKNIDLQLATLNKIYAKIDQFSRKVNVYEFTSDSTCYRSSKRTLIGSMDSFLYANFIKNVKSHGIVNFNKTGARLFGYNILKDRNLAHHDNKSQLYGHWLTRKGSHRVIKNSVNNIALIDETRSEIGLPSLYIQSLKWGFLLPEGYSIPPNNR